MYIDLESFHKSNIGVLQSFLVGGLVAVFFLLSFSNSTQAAGYNPGYLMHIEFQCEKALHRLSRAQYDIVTCITDAECEDAYDQAYAACVSAESKCQHYWTYYEPEGGCERYQNL